MMRRYVLFCCLLVGVISCQGPKKKAVSPSEPNNGDNRTYYFEGRISVEDLVKKKNQSVKVEAFLLKNKKMRIEANGPLSIRVASILVTENQIQAQLYLERKYFSGTFDNVWKYDQQTLKAVSLPVAPKFLQNMFFQDRNLGSHWKCEKDAASEECINLSPPPRAGERQPEQPSKLTWVKGEDGLTRFFAESPKYRLRWEPSAAPQILEDNPKLFMIEVNESFKKVDITPR